MSDSLSSSFPKIDPSRVDQYLAGRLAPAGYDQPAFRAGATPEAASPAQAAGYQAKNPRLDISLKFQIDEQTRDVTLLILDRATREVIRSIPPEAMNEMDPGELLELFG